MSIYLAYLNITFMNDTSNKMISHTNILRPFMKHLTFSQTNSTPAITLFRSARSNLLKVQSINISTK